jgi:hypothetical protein
MTSDGSTLLLSTYWNNSDTHSSLSQKIRKENVHKSSFVAKRWKHNNWNLYLSVLWIRIRTALILVEWLDPDPGGQK